MLGVKGTTHQLYEGAQVQYREPPTGLSQGGWIGGQVNGWEGEGCTPPGHGGSALEFTVGFSGQHHWAPFT